MRFALFGNGPSAVDSVKKLLDRDHEAVLIVERASPSDAGLARLAEDLSVSLARPANVNSAEFVGVLKTLSPDMIVSVWYDQIFHSEVLSIPTLASVNCHAGMLPLYRGRSTIKWAIVNGEDEQGITVHHMDPGVDTGDIILQESLPISWADTYGSVLDRVLSEMPQLLDRAVRLIEEGTAPRIKQPEMSGTYYCHLRPSDGNINWGSTSREIYNRIRALTRPGPGARTKDEDGREFLLWSATYDPGWPSYRSIPGDVVGRDSAGVRIKTGDSTILVTELADAEGQELRRLPAVGARFVT